MVYEIPTEAIAAERRRHRILSELLDDRTGAQFDHAGLASGWCCLEIGCGGGSVAAMLADRVGADGEVLAVDINLRLSDEFLPEVPPQLSLREYNIEEGPPQLAHFDLVHARALLEHLVDPATSLRHMYQSLRPGGHLAVSGSDWSLFDQQDLPDPFGALMAQMHRLVELQENSHQRRMGAKLLPMLNELGFVDIHAEGHVWLMRGGQPSAEWFIQALEWALPDLTSQGLVDGELATRALAQAREPDFTILSPVHLAVNARRP